jgi:Tfp pilus assembly protein PilO
MDAKKAEVVVAYIQESLGLMVSLFHEKGWKYFKNPLMVGVGVSFFFYYTIYSPANGSLRTMNAEAAAVQAQAQNASTFNTYKAEHIVLEGQLPFLQNKADWLTSVVSQACAAENINPEKITPPQENESLGTGSIQGSIQFTVSADYNTLGRLVAMIENNPKIVKITELSVSRNDHSGPGMLRADITLSTIFPKTRLGLQAPPPSAKPQQAPGAPVK